MGDWDKGLKSLIAEKPVAFAQIAFKQLGMDDHAITSATLLDTRFQGYDQDADGLLLTTLEDGEEILSHIEFQSVKDANMPDRQLEYCFRARKKYGPKPAVSSVIYLRDVGEVPQPPHTWETRSGWRMMTFEYLSLNVTQMTPDELRAFGQPALLPLTLLAKGGANRTMVTNLFSELHENGLRHLWSVTNLLAALAFKKSPSDLSWLEQEYLKMTDILKESPAYEWMTADAYKEGVEIGRAEKQDEWLVKGQVEQSRGIITAIISKRFPTVAGWTQKQLSFIKDPMLLKELATQVALAQTLGEAKDQIIEAFDKSVPLPEATQAHLTD